MGDSNLSTEDRWVLASTEHELVQKKNRANRLGFAILLTFFREHGRFPRDESEIDAQVIVALCNQLDVASPEDGEAFLTGRTAERLCAEIRARFEYHEATVADAEAFTLWLRDHVAAEAGGEITPMIERLEARCRELSIKPPTADRVERIARKAIRAHEERFYAEIHGHHSSVVRERLDALLRSEGTDGEVTNTDYSPALVVKLRGSPGKPSLTS